MSFPAFHVCLNAALVLVFNAERIHKKRNVGQINRSVYQRFILDQAFHNRKKQPVFAIRQRSQAQAIQAATEGVSDDPAGKKFPRFP